MDRDELVFVLRSIADDVEKGFKQAEQAVEDLGRSYEDLTDAEKRMQDANDDLRKRLDAMKKTMNSVNLESARMPRELRQVTAGFKAAASGAGAFAVAMIGIQLVAGLITKIAEAAKKAKEELAKLNEEADRMAAKTGGMSYLVDRYEQLYRKAVRTKEETSEMEGISRTLVDTYGMRADAVDAEGRLLLMNVDYMREQVALQRERTRLTLIEAESKNAESVAKAIKDMTEASESIDQVERRIGELKAALAEPFDATDRMEVQARANMQKTLEMLERSYEAYDEAIRTGNEAVWDQAQQSMQLALIEMGDEAVSVTVEIQNWAIQEIVNSGVVPTATLMMEKFAEGIRLGIGPAKDAGKEIQLTAEQIDRMAAKARAAKTDLKGMTSSVQGLDNSTASLKKEIQDLNDLQTAINVLKEGDQSSKDFGLALDYLAERYGVSAEQVLENLEVYQRDAEIKATLLELNLLLAEQEAIMAKQTAVAMASAGDITVYQASRMIEALDGVLLKLRQLSGEEGAEGTGINFKNIGLNIGRTSWSAPRTTKTSGGASAAQAYKNEALEAELAMIERKRKLDQLTTAEEIILLERAAKTLAKTVQEREELYDKAYALKKAMAQASLEHDRAMDQLTLAEEIKHQEKLVASYKKGTEARLDAERELYRLKKEEARRAYESDVYFGRLTLEQQRERTRAMIQDYKAGTDARIELERQLYDVQQEIRNRDTENLDRMTQGVIGALQNRYSVHREEELSALQASMDAWGDWAQVQVDAINAQIRALDDLTKQEDRGDEETRRRRKIAALEQQLLYETDEYNRRKLEEQLAREKDDLSKWQTRNEREDQKQALRDQATHVQDRARAEQDALREQMDAVNEYYAERLKAQNLAAEAEYVMMEGSMDDIVELMKSYAPEYDILGQTLGEKMYEGFMEKAKGIADYIAQINRELQATQDKAAQLATQSAVEYWQGQGAPVVTQSGGSTKTTSNAVTINVYDTQDSPAQLAREVERTLDRLSRV